MSRWGPSSRAESNLTLRFLGTTFVSNNYPECTTNFQQDNFVNEWRIKSWAANIFSLTNKIKKYLKPWYYFSLTNIYWLMTSSLCSIGLLFYDACQPGPPLNAAGRWQSKGVWLRSITASELYIALGLFRSWHKQTIDVEKRSLHSASQQQRTTLLWVWCERLSCTELCQTSSRQFQHDNISRHTMVTPAWLGSVQKGFILLFWSTSLLKAQSTFRKRLCCVIRCPCLLLISNWQTGYTFGVQLPQYSKDVIASQ